MVFALSTTLRELEQQHESALSSYLAALATLRDTAGSRRYTDQEHERLVRETESNYDQAVDLVNDGYRDLEKQIETDAKAAKPGDIITTFAGVDLERATQLREFVKEQYDGASVDQVRARLNTALTADDKVIAALNLRYAEAWSNSPARRTGEAVAIARLIEQLELRFTDVAKLERAEEERKLVLDSKKTAGVPAALLNRGQRYRRRHIQSTVQRMVEPS